MVGALHTRWTERELLDVAELISEVYPPYYGAQFALFLAGERDAVGLPAITGNEDIVEELKRRFPYPTFDPAVISDTVFCRGESERQAARRLVDEGPQMTGDEIHRCAGRAFGYPDDAVEFFIDRFDSPYPSVADSRITANDLLREGAIPPDAWGKMKLVPYVHSGDREAVLENVAMATRWDSALPDGVDY